ncbi:MAG TPA: metal ABC transporter substrate-binding protein [Candidatus Deferrimicrobium sp.]|nr:metal ABC transporter substrate-binding protein [Candidatus Deferrimicrobium sp.]
MFRFKYIIAIMLCLLLVGCSTGSPKDKPVNSGKSSSINVVTSITPLADIITNIGGDKVQVSALIKPGNDPHDYEPTPEDAKKLSAAAVFFANGVGEEPYLTKLVKNAGAPNTKIVTLSDGLEIIGKGSTDSDYAQSGNPHLWLDVKNVQAYAKKIRDTLSLAAPEDSAYFSANADKYLGELEQLDKDITAKIQSIPPADRRMIVFHDAWPYFTKRYGLQNLKPVVKHSDSEPSAKEYAELITYIKEQKVKAVFAEAGFNPKLVKQLAQDTGVAFVNNLYDDTVAENGPATTYIKMMEVNADTIVKALK